MLRYSLADLLAELELREFELAGAEWDENVGGAGEVYWVDDPVGLVGHWKRGWVRCDDGCVADAPFVAVEFELNFRRVHVDWR